MKPVYILGTDGSVPDPSQFNVTELLRVVGANSGNLMFQHAVARLIADPKIFIGITGLPYLDASGCADGSYLVFPAANHLRTGADWHGLCGFFENTKVPLLVFGLGAQADSTDDPTATAAALMEDQSAMRLVKVLKDKAAWISVRGEFTAKVCELLGIHNVEILGCPSLTLNPDPAAGENMAKKIQSFAESGHHKIAVTAAAPFEISSGHKREIERDLLRLLCSCSGSYVQQSGGDAVCALAMNRFNQLNLASFLSIHSILLPGMGMANFLQFCKERMKMYYDAGKWIEAMRPFDLCLGTRLHGNMAAIAAGTPGCVISHDSRTGELAEEMRLPRINAAELENISSLKQLADHITFDATAFDRSRSEKISRYKDAFARLGLQMSGDQSSPASFDLSITNP